MEEPSLPILRLPETLLVLPCSAKKAHVGSTAGRGHVSILDSLPKLLANELNECRITNAADAEVDESTRLPAIDRYAGHLYKSAGPAAFSTLSQSRAGVLIVSGGYGVVLADELIGDYNMAYRASKWPRNLIGRCLAQYAECIGASTVVGLFSATTSYARTFRRAPWTCSRVFLAAPEPPASAAMVRVPRAQGEALAAISCEHRLRPSWRSSDELRMQVTQLVGRPAEIVQRAPGIVQLGEVRRRGRSSSKVSVRQL